MIAMCATVNLEDRVRAWEDEFLARAGDAAPTRRSGAAEEPDSPLRTPFQRDRDRIVHSKAFRRLKHKTQVFIAPEGDHYRTRLTHTLEACGIARTVARALGLNEDLTEAIGLGHDLGHPPFGHIGEEALDAGAARARRDGLPPQRALAAGRRRARARRRTASTSPSRSATASSTTPASTSRRRSRAGSCGSSTASPTSTTTSTTPCAPGSCAEGTCRPRRSSCSARPARRGSTRWSATSSSSSRARRRHRPERGGGRRDAAPAQVHVRPRLPRRRRRAASRSGSQRTLRGALRPLPRAPRGGARGRAGRRRPASGSTDYLAGMTDRFCIARFSRAGRCPRSRGSSGR